MNGSVVSVLISDVGMSGAEHSIMESLGAETCQLPWSSMESECGNLAASMEPHGVPWRAQCGYWTFSWRTVRSRGGRSHSWSAMDSAVWILDILMEYHEKSELWEIATPAEFCGVYPWICGESVFSE